MFIDSRSFGKIVFMGITITITGAMLLIGLPFMFSALFYFIDILWSGVLFFIGIVILAIFVFTFLNDIGYI
ncbi:hypothetical protein METP1_02738 [Methanosarcinales archaeon]|nr:hypothetical protein METP1_02738 [Methanosarcinales archaeon]